MKKTLLYALGIILLAACSDNDDSITDVPPTDNNKPEWYYAGGELGTAYPPQRMLLSNLHQLWRTQA